MHLPAGSRLGPYEIVAPAGAGGMGEVYKAKDTRLNRSVAIKVLPAHVRDDEQLRQRFEREAQAVAALDHPHICTLHDISRHNNIDFLVLEYLEGETLADRLARGPLPLEEVLRYGIETAEALHRAHRQGIIHRDLKPGNIMLTKAGVKVLDFGLAKTIEPGGVANAVTAAPTRQQALTAEGTILGTFQYMAPEQLEARESDPRTDIFALGVVLYEMATGRRAFDGSSQVGVMASILTQDPPSMTTLQPAVPTAFARAVKKAMAKDPDRRWQTAADLADELRWIAENAVVAATVPPAGIAARSRASWMVAAVLGVGLLSMVPSFVSHLRERPRPAIVTRFAIAPPAQTVFGAFDTAALSPDGRYIVFSASGATTNAPAAASTGGRTLWLRRLDALDPRALAGTDGGIFPFWSPDSRYVGFFAGGKLRTVAIDGGPPETLSDAPQSGGGTWNDRGEILFTPRWDEPLHVVSATGGESKPLTALDKAQREQAHVWPQFLPDGRTFLYLTFFTNNAVRLNVGSLDRPDATPLPRVASQARFAPPDRLLFVRNGVLVVQRLDLASRQLIGEPAAIAQGLSNVVPVYGQFAVSASNLAYMPAAGEIALQLTVLDRAGRQVGVVGEPGDYSNPALSPDGNRVAVGRRNSQTQMRDIWVFDLARGSSSRLTFDQADDFNPVWSGDGHTVMFSSIRQSGQRDIYRKLASGAQPEEVVLNGKGEKAVDDWSRDGRFVVYDTAGGSATDLYRVALTGDRKPVPVAARPFNERSAAISPDGRWMAYASNESGRPEVWVQTFPEPTARWQVSAAGGADPMWRGDGRELFFLWQGRLWSVNVTATRDAFDASVPRMLFEVPRLAESGRNRYVVSPDGQRFIALTGVGDPRPVPLTVVVNWPDALPNPSGR